MKTFVLAIALGVLPSASHADGIILACVKNGKLVTVELFSIQGEASVSIEIDPIAQGHLEAGKDSKVGMTKVAFEHSAHSSHFESINKTESTYVSFYTDSSGAKDVLNVSVEDERIDFNPTQDCVSHLKH